MTEAAWNTFTCGPALTSKAVRLRLIAATVAACLFAAGCASDGQTLRAPSADQTTTSRPLPVTTPPEALTSPLGLELESPDFDAGGPVPNDATCEGANTVPNLEWSGPELEDGAELAISLTDQTDIEEPLLLWLVTGIPTSVTSISSGILPTGAVETLNDYGESGFGSPCIDTSDSAERDLQFRLHVLSEVSGVEAAAPGNEAFAQVNALTIDAAAVLMTVGSTLAANAASN